MEINYRLILMLYETQPGCDLLSKSIFDLLINTII